jgi:glyoxylase-like metal-dependent hydrolase (beta-lactamase superfamily II)
MQNGILPWQSICDTTKLEHAQQEPVMDEEPRFDRRFDVAHGETVRLTPLIRRLVAPNPGPFTFTGTCTYIVGTRNVCVIDPGPDDATHLAATLKALKGERVSHILVTHTHRDHSPGARTLSEAVGAPIWGCGPHVAARELSIGEIDPLDASVDRDYAPARHLQDGDVVTGDGWRLTALATPGHTMNHLAFSLAEETALFSGDHVMAWSTSIVAPPDGAMSAYMASLERLKGRNETIYWPGHGGPVMEPARFVRGLLSHRHQREAAILRRIVTGDGTIKAMVPLIYENINPVLHGAAALSVFAQLEDMVARGIVITDGPPLLSSRYRPA